MENVLRMRLRVRWRARLIDLLNALQMKGFRSCQNHFPKSNRRRRRFLACRRGRGACATRGSSGQDTGIRRIACIMSELVCACNKCTCGKDFLLFRHELDGAAA